MSADVAPLFARVQADLTTARRAQDKEQLLLLSTILADLKNRELELARALSDTDVVEVVRRGIKRRRESAEMYEKGGRDALAQREAAEAAQLEQYLPAQVSADELRAAVRAAISGGASTIGAVMGRVMPQFKGRADGSQINAIAREEFASGA